MELTLRILIHELEEKYGPVLVGNVNVKHQCSDVRLYDGNTLEKGYLYVFDEDVEMARELEKAPLTLSVGTHSTLEHAKLALPGSASLIEVFTFLQQVFLRYRTWVQDMDTSIIHDEGLQSLFDLSESFLLNNIIVVDPALKLLAYTKNIECDDEVTVELIKHGYHTEENIRKFQLNQRFEPWAKQNGYIINRSKAICKYTTAVFSFKTMESFSLIIVMMCNNCEPDPWLLDAFMLFLIRVAYYSKRDYTSDAPSGSAVNAFLKDLLTGTLKNPEAIEERRRYLGIPDDGPFCLFDAEIGGSQHLASRIVTDIARNTAPAKAMIYRNSIVVLCFSCHDNACAYACSSGSCPLHRSTVTQRLEQTLSEYGVCAGRSSSFNKLAMLPNALHQAHAALQAGLTYMKEHGATDLHKATSIYCFDEYYFEHFIQISSKDEREFLTTLHGCRMLSNIRAYDEEHSTDNYRFLYSYLKCERRTTLVAEELHMHRNNVKYRLDRLGTLFNIDTEDAHSRFELMTAYRIMASLER